MPVKNAVAKIWSITPSGDNRRWSAYPAGDKPGFNPIIAFTDFIAGPTTGGESNKGCYLTLYGWNFGNFSDYGSTNHVYIGGVEVDNYRCLDNAPGSGSAGMGNGVYETWGLKRLTVQVGTLGSPTAGTALNISMTVNGRSLGNPVTSGQYFDYLSGDALTFTPQPGPIIFVDPVSGNDANAGTFASPKKSLQDSTIFGTGALKSGSTSSDTSGTKPGTHIYLRGGTYANQGNLSTNLNGRWANFFRIGGLAPTGATNRGPICITSYPGAAGANTRELAVYNPGAGVSAGGGFIWINGKTAASITSFGTGTGGTGTYNIAVNLSLSSQTFTTALPGTGDQSASTFDCAAQYWADAASNWTTIERYAIYNLINEVGPVDTTVWRDSALAAVQKMRTAGYTGLIMIDAPGSGQDSASAGKAGTIIRDAGYLFNNDPQKNLCVSLHVYGVYRPGELWSILQQTANVTTTTGVPFVIGEFGPDILISVLGSRSLEDQREIMATALAANLSGWMSWAWDDHINDNDASGTSDSFYAMAKNSASGGYNTSDPTQLTRHGKRVVLDPYWGIAAKSVKATVFP